MKVANMFQYNLYSSCNTLKDNSKVIVGTN